MNRNRSSSDSKRISTSCRIKRRTFPMQLSFDSSPNQLNCCHNRPNVSVRHPILLDDTRAAFNWLTSEYLPQGKDLLSGSRHVLRFGRETETPGPGWQAGGRRSSTGQPRRGDSRKLRSTRIRRSIGNADLGSQPTRPTRHLYFWLA